VVESKPGSRGTFIHFVQVFGQEQDSLGGGFNEVESFVGKMFDTQVWDYLLDETEVQSLYTDCKKHDGNLFSWYDVLANVHGNILVS
jgi:CUB/sushi domain-containing protein